MAQGGDPAALERALLVADIGRLGDGGPFREVARETLREFLRQEGVRIQREIDGYARLSEEAVKSTKIIGESVAQWKTTLANLGSRRT